VRVKALMGHKYHIRIVALHFLQMIAESIIINLIKALLY
jgi:hypothetical protein